MYSLCLAAQHIESKNKLRFKYLTIVRANFFVVFLPYQSVIFNFKCPTTNPPQIFG